MEKTKLTEDQELKLKKLIKTAKWRAVKIGFKNVSLLFFMTFMIAILNVSYVHSETFLGLGAFFNGFTLFYIGYKDVKNESEWIKQEIDKILKNN